MTQLDAVVFMRGRGRRTSLSSIGRWEAFGSIPLDEAADLVVVGYGASLDAVVTRAVEIAEQRARVAAVDPGEVESASARAEQRSQGGSRRGRTDGTRRAERRGG
jgi:hypothetical protein